MGNEGIKKWESKMGRNSRKGCCQMGDKIEKRLDDIMGNNFESRIGRKRKRVEEGYVENKKTNINEGLYVQKCTLMRANAQTVELGENVALE